MYNRELLQINTENKAYLLGLFYSDGSISFKGYLCRIQLKDTDKELLEKIVENFPFFKTYNKREGAITIWCSSKNLHKDLKENGVLPRKSFENKNLVKFPKINSVLYKDFIRGYLDGNGTVALNKKTGKNTSDKKVFVYSVSVLFLRQLKYVLFKNKINSSIYKDTREILFNGKKHNTTLYRLSVPPRNLVKLYEFLYSHDSKIFLKRKKDTFDLIYNSPFFIEAVCPKCPICKGKLVKNGVYNYKNVLNQRFLCKKCNTNFLETALVSSNINNGEDELLEN